MKEGTLLFDHPEEFNKIIIDLRNVDIKLDEEDQFLILLYSLPISLDNFINSIL